MAVADYVLEARDISKRFGRGPGHHQPHAAAERGEILALVGDNGAGKSTLIKVIAGALKKDSGEIWLDGRKVEFENPMHAKTLGIEVVYQDLSLINHLNVYQNLFLGASCRNASARSRSSTRERWNSRPSRSCRPSGSG